MITPFFVWLALALLCMIFEVGHPGLFFFLSFSCGALVAGVVSLYSASMAIQLTAFFAGTAAAFLLLRRFIARSSSALHRTNVEALVGKRGVVLERVGTDLPGRVRIGGETWLARAARAPEIVESTEVTVVAIRGAHVVVAPYDGH